MTPKGIPTASHTMAPVDKPAPSFKGGHRVPACTTVPSGQVILPWPVGIGGQGEPIGAIILPGQVLVGHVLPASTGVFPSGHNFVPGPAAGQRAPTGKDGYPGQVAILLKGLFELLNAK